MGWLGQTYCIMKDIRIGKTTFNPSSIEMMGFKTFKEVYQNKLDGVSPEVAYKLITGKNPKKHAIVRKTENDHTEDS